MRRCLYTLAIFLVLGAVVNVAVVWGCATWPALKLVSKRWGVQATEVDQGWWQQAMPAGGRPKGQRGVAKS